MPAAPASVRDPAAPALAGCPPLPAAAATPAVPAVVAVKPPAPAAAREPAVLGRAAAVVPALFLAFAAPPVGVAALPACALVLAGLAMLSVGVLVAACAPAEPVLGVSAACPQLTAAIKHAAAARRSEECCSRAECAHVTIRTTIERASFNVNAPGSDRVGCCLGCGVKQPL
ncbi:MAG TPA: hypothetical protein VFN67_30640 [Polyangiales bacterium]|nr:hypothetical protein [Polyangiales bacterium]